MNNVYSVATYFLYHLDSYYKFYNEKIEDQLLRGLISGFSIKSSSNLKN